MKTLNHLSLRSKVTLCTAGVVVLLGLLGTLFTREILTSTLRAELDNQGRVIATNLATRAIDPILRADFLNIHHLNEETLAKNSDLRYIFVVDPRGNIIDHTFKSGFPAGLRNLSTSELGVAYQVQLLQTEEGFIRDIAMPLLGGRAGVLHIGMTEARINATVTQVTQVSSMAAGVALAIAGALAWLLAHLVTKPILQLVRVAEAVGGGDLSRRASLSNRDEVGLLGRAFDSMTEQLATRIEELQVSNIRLSTLNSIAILVGKTEPLDAVLTEILGKVLPLVRADAGGVLLQDRDAGPGYWVQRGFSQAFVEGIASLMATRGNARDVLDFQEYPVGEMESLESPFLSRIEKEGLAIFLSFPFGVKEERRGALHVARRAQQPFSPRERELLSSVAAQTGVMLTNRQLLQEATQAEALRHLNRMKSEFTVRASHELRTPATALKGYIETLLRPDMALRRHEERQLLKDMDEVCDRLNRLVQDVLNISRLESGALDIKQERLAVRPLLQRITQRLGRQSPRHRLQLRLDRDLGYARGDADRLEDVLENLITNAVKYSPAGGTITVSAVNGSSWADRRQSPKTSPFEPDFVTIAVRDQGIGIPAEAVPKLFQQFYQVAAENHTRAGGIGMGLFICKSYIEAMGGSIWVESEEGKGSTFSFTLPVGS